MRTDRYGNTRGQKFHAKGKVKEVKVQEFMYRGTTNVEHVMYYSSSSLVFSLRGRAGRNQSPVM